MKQVTKNRLEHMNVTWSKAPCRLSDDVFVLIDGISLLTEATQWKKEI